MKSWILFFSLIVISYQGYTQKLVVNVGVIIDELADPCDGPITLDTEYPGYNHLWSTGETTQKIKVTKTAVYTVIVTDPNNPSIVGYDTVPVTYFGAFKIDLGPDTSSFCAGCISLDAGDQGPGTRYQWSNGETTQKVRICKSGKVSVTATNRFGCTASDNIFLNIIGDKAYTFNPSPDVNVCGKTTVTLKSGVTPGVGRTLWSNGATTESINVTTSGKYWVKIFNLTEVCNSNNDTIIDTINVNINDPIINFGNDISKCGGCVTLSAGNQPPGSTFAWSTGSTENSINVCSPGLNVISLKVTAPGGCSSTEEINVDIKDNFTADLKGDVLECAATHTITAPSYPAKYLWNTGESTSSITVTNSGTYKVKIYDFADCAKTDTLTDEVNVTFVPTLPIPGAITEISGPCVDKKFSVAPVNGISNYRWSVPEGWTILGQGTTQITVQAPPGTKTGTVSVQSANATNECQSGSSFLPTEFKSFGVERYNSFTPNNDGINDVYVFKNLNFYPENTLVVLNRWGNEVYRKQGYTNDWDGSGLNEGTYFYKLNWIECGQAKEYTGNVTIVR